jgi:hypothetical protein
MPQPALVAGAVVRGKTIAYLNKKGIIDSVDGKTYHITWEGSNVLVPCSKHAFDLWKDGDERFPRGNRGGAAAAGQPVVRNERNNDDNRSVDERHSEAGSVAANDRDDAENVVDPEDLEGEEGEGGAVQNQEDQAVVNAAGGVPNIVQPVVVNVERRQGQRVLETRAWVEQEVSVALETDQPVWSRPPKLKWTSNKYTAGVDGSGSKSALQYYMLFQSPESLDMEVECTNRNLRLRPNEPAAALALTVPELLRKRGIRLSMVLEPLRGGSVADYWASTSVPGTFQQPRCYGKRMRMSKHRFEALESAMQYCELDRGDRWWPIRKLLERFNEHMKLVFVAGKWVTIDESGFWWLGKDGQWHHDGMPHVTKIIRKPRSVMAELKSLCDAISGIMIAVELQEGKDAMKAKEFASAPFSFPHHVALDLRLTKIAGLHGSGRVLVGDSYFSSVNALQRLHEYGLFFWGIVKTATALYPMRALKEKSAEVDAPNRRENRGKHNTFVSEYQVAGVAHKMAAIAWHGFAREF